MILVTGGTGLVGSHLLYFLLKEGKTVRAVHRAHSNFKHVKEVFKNYHALDTLFPNIEWVVADITDVPALNDAFKGVTEVYHCAALVDFTASYKTLKKINTEGTANVVNACLYHPIKKLAYVSSIAALGESVNNAPITESTTWSPDTDNSNYGIAKYGAEMEVWRGTQEGLNAVIINPGVIFGEGHWDSGTGALIKKIAKGIPHYPTGSINMVDVVDVCKALLATMLSEEKNKGYIAVGHTLSYKDFFTLGARIAGGNLPKRKLTRWKLTLADYLEPLLFFKKKQLTPFVINSLYTHKTYDGSLLEKRFDFSYTPVEETMQRIIDRFMNR